MLQALIQGTFGGCWRNSAEDFKGWQAFRMCGAYVQVVRNALWYSGILGNGASSIWKGFVHHGRMANLFLVKVLVVSLPLSIAISLLLDQWVLLSHGAPWLTSF